MSAHAIHAVVLMAAVAWNANVFNREQKGLGEIGFENQAHDSEDQKKQISKKFKEDAASACASAQNPEVFRFLTNINLTIGGEECADRIRKGRRIQNLRSDGS